MIVLRCESTINHDGRATTPLLVRLAFWLLLVETRRQRHLHPARRRRAAVARGDRRVVRR